MKYDVLKRVKKKRFVMLLINIKVCKIDECEKVEKEIKRSIVIVNRDKRKNVVNFDHETIFVYNIDFFDVVNEKTDEKADEKNNSIVIKKVKEIEINEKINEKNEKKNEKDKANFS